MKTVLLLGGPAAGQRVEVHGVMAHVLASDQVHKVVPMCSHGEVHWFGVLDGADPLALLIDGYGMNVVPKAERSAFCPPALAAAAYGSGGTSGTGAGGTSGTGAGGTSGSGAGGAK